MRMTGYSPREFTAILTANGWHRSHGSNHVTYIKNGCPNIITIPLHHNRELSRPLCKRLLKESGIIL